MLASAAGAVPGAGTKEMFDRYNNGCVIFNKAGTMHALTFWMMLGEIPLPYYIYMEKAGSKSVGVHTF